MIAGQWHRFTEEEIKYRPDQEWNKFYCQMPSMNEWNLNWYIPSHFIFPLVTNMPNVVIVFSNQTDVVNNSTLNQLDYTLN